MRHTTYLQDTPTPQHTRSLSSQNTVPAGIVVLFGIVFTILGVQVPHGMDDASTPPLPTGDACCAQWALAAHAGLKSECHTPGITDWQSTTMVSPLVELQTPQQQAHQYLGKPKPSSALMTACHDNANAHPGIVFVCTAIFKSTC